jgi:hypothetical protein
MLDLYNKKYSREELKNNIYSIKLIDIVKTQKIDVSFAVKYLLNKKYQFHNDDLVNTDMILKYQPHITKFQLKNEILNYDSENDSIENFEVISEK